MAGPAIASVVRSEIQPRCEERRMYLNEDGNSQAPDAEESLIDLANRLVETADQLLKAACVLATLVEQHVPSESILRALLDYNAPAPSQGWITPPPVRPLAPGAWRRAFLPTTSFTITSTNIPFAT